jgi:phosphatidylcholine synthase
VVIAAIFTFLPIHFLHPVRVQRLRSLNLGMTLLWCALGAVALLQGMEAQPWVRWGIAASGMYLFFIGGIMQLFPTLGARKVPTP